jgi:L-ascorbate metabolism protein UlaG (beta-lactamase superfamily)
MENHHLNPEQAGRAFLECGARRMVPMHWGTFQMTDEPLSAPIERLRRWWDTAAIPEGRELLTPAVGETLRLVDVPYPFADVTR